MGQIQSSVTAVVGSLTKQKNDLNAGMELNSELTSELMNPEVQRGSKKSGSAVKMGQNQAKVKSQQKKNTKVRFEITKGGKLRGI